MKNQSNQTQGKKKKSHKKLWIILGIIAVVIIALVVKAVKTVQEMTTQIVSAMENTAPAELGEIEVTTEGIGVVEAAEITTVYTDYNVTVKEVYKQDGEHVAAGEVIAEYEGIVLDETVATLEAQLAQIEAQLSYMSKSGDTTVSAPVAGRVKRIFANQGDSVLTVQSQQEALAVISADGKLKVEFVPETEVVEGQKVTILYDDKSIEGNIIMATVNKATAVFEDSSEYEIDYEVTVQSEDGVLIGKGLTACGHEILVTADSGYVKEVSVKENSKISAGTTMFRLEEVEYSPEYLNLLEQRELIAEQLRDARAYKAGYVITAAEDSIVSGLSVKAGDKLPAGSALCNLLKTGEYQVNLDIDELDIQGIATGQSVEVTVDAVEDVIYQGTVSGISMVGNNQSGVGSYKVCVQLDEAEDLLPGMSANGKVTMEYKQDALLVPIDTLQTIDGEKTVTVIKEDGTYETRQVKVGLVNNEYAEILEGVQEGEELQVIVKLEDFYSQMGITIEEGTME